jgi:hypothetical protein
VTACGPDGTGADCDRALAVGGEIESVLDLQREGVDLEELMVCGGEDPDGTVADGDREWPRAGDVLLEDRLEGFRSAGSDCLELAVSDRLQSGVVYVVPGVELP